MRVLADRVSTALAERRSQPERRYSADTWLSDYLIPAVNQFSFGGASYPFGVNFTQAGVHIHEIVSTLPGYSAALRACPPAFAAQMVRALVLSQARFTFRNRPSARTPRRLFGTSALAPLEKPWTNATTGELLARMEWHAGLAGNAYVTNRSANRLRVLRPDWVAIVYGSHQEPEQAAYALDGEIIGYVYAVGGLNAYGGQLSPMLGGKIYTLLPEEVAHWSPLPDPEGSGIGQSWITPAVKDMQSDRAATDMKLRFWAQGSTPNMVVKGLKAATKEQFDDIVNMLEERHSGIANAFKTLYLTEGADATVVGSNFREMDLKNVQGASETRISSLSRVPASLLGIAEGLAGSSLNAGNFGMARRIFADTWVYPTLQDLAAALSPLVRVPSDAELWFDVADMPLLREDGKDAAEIEAIKAETITKYVREGFTADSAIAAVRGQDVSLLVHTNLVSVQLQAPGAPAVGAAPAAGPPAAGPPPDFSALRAPPGKAPPPGGGPTTRSLDDELDDELRGLDEDTEALIQALAEFGDEDRAAFNPALHPRNPRGAPGGGRFRSIVQRITDALESWSKGNGPDDPLKDFDREQLRLAAKARGLTLRRGASRDEIHAALLADLKASVKAQRETPKSAKFTLQGPNHNGLDVAVYRDPQGRPALFRENDAGKRGALVAQFDDLAGLEKWADGNGEPRLAEWARKERGAPAVPAKKARAKKAAPIVAPPADGLDKMADHSLRDLAMEYGLKVPTIDQMPQHRQRLIEELRKLGAVSPALKVAREKARDDLDEHLFQLGRRKPANTAPLDRAVLAMANGDDGKAVALGLRRDAIAEKASLSAEDLKTYQLLATRIGSIKPRPAWLNDNGNIVLDKLVRAEAPSIDLATVESASIRDWLEGRNPQPDFASHPWARTFEHKRDDLQTGKTTRAKAVREFRDQATFIDKRVAEIEAKDVAWRKQHDRTPYAIKWYKPTPAEEKLRADGPAAAKAYRELADLLAAAKIPAKPRQKSLAPTELGEVLPIDESRFRSVPFHAAVTTRGQPLDPGFGHRGSTGGGVMFLFAPGVSRPQRDGLTRTESGALDHYTVGRVARALNGSLRKGHNAHGEVSFPEIGLKDPIDLDAMRAGMDSAIEAGTLDTDTVLWRGVLLKKADRNRLVPGAILSDPAYSSTTVSEHDADRVIDHWRQAGLYKGSAPAKFKILAPAGTHGAVGHAAVSEVVLARDQKFRIVREEPPGKDGVPVFVLEAVAPETDSGLVRGHDVVDTFDYTAVPKLTSTWSSATSSPDGVAQRAIYEEQGFTGPPRVITVTEMDEAIKRRGAVELFRGFRPTRKNDGSASVDRTAASFAEQFRTGELYLGSGGAVYGRGTYASPDRTFAASYAGRARSGTSAAIAKAEEGVVMRMALRRDARVIHYDDVRKLHLKAMPRAMRELDEKQKAELDAVDRADTAKIQEILDRYAHLRQKSSVRSRVISDLGNFAALMGYDAIVVPVEYRGGKGKGSPTEYVILNRTALLVQEAST